MKKIKLLLIIILILSSCSEPTNHQITNLPDSIVNGCYILCEGLFGQNNSTLSVIDFDNDKIYNNYFFQKNNEKIGDTGNDILVNGDTSFIIVSTNNKIIAFNTRTCSLIKTINSEKLNTPRKIAKLNDSLLAITNLKGNSITFLNLKNLKVSEKELITGPAPEGIAISNDYIFVANSGYGDYLSNEYDAGTIYVFDKNTSTLKTKFINLPNVIQLIYNESENKLYARYNNLPSLKDSLGGIVEFDVNTLKEIRRWKIRVYYFTLDKSLNIIYYLNDYGVGYIDLKNGFLERNFIKNSNPNEIWYSIFYDNNKDNLFITNAKNYQSKGEILIYKLKDSIQIPIKYNAGLNPSTIVFF